VRGFHFSFSSALAGEPIGSGHKFDPFESKGLKPVFHFIRFQGLCLGVRVIE
jgi:hypothetical protein